MSSNTHTQTGRTSQQMTDAPPGSVYVWCNDRTDYPLDLARHLGRKDLRVRPLSWLDLRTVAGSSCPAVIVDHAAHLSDRARDALRYLSIRAGEDEA